MVLIPFLRPPKTKGCVGTGIWNRFWGIRESIRNHGIVRPSLMRSTFGLQMLAS